MLKEGWLGGSRGGFAGKAVWGVNVEVFDADICDDERADVKWEHARKKMARFGFFWEGGGGGVLCALTRYCNTFDVAGLGE